VANPEVRVGGGRSGSLGAVHPAGVQGAESPLRVCGRSSPEAAVLIISSYHIISYQKFIVRPLLREPRPQVHYKNAKTHAFCVIPKASSRIPNCKISFLSLDLFSLTFKNISLALLWERWKAIAPIAPLPGMDLPLRQTALRTWSMDSQGCSGAGTRGGTASPTFFDRGDASPLPATFWSEIRAKVSRLLQLVTY